MKVPREHDDSKALGQLAFTWRVIDMPERGNGNWSQANKEQFTAARGGSVVLSRTIAWSAPPPPECPMFKAAAAVIQHYYGPLETVNGKFAVRDMMESDHQEWLLNTNQGWEIWPARSCEEKCPLAIPMRSQSGSITGVHIIPDNVAKRAL